MVGLPRLWPTNQRPGGLPSLADLCSSRKLRLWLPVAATCLVLLSISNRYDALSTIRSGWPETGKGVNDDGLTPSNGASVDWSRFAYTQYVTNSHYLCNSVMLFERLQHVGSRADRVLMYPRHMFDPNASEGDLGADGFLVKKARDEYGAHLVPIHVQRRDTADSTWEASFTKLLAFNQTQYDRVLSLDSDSTVMQNMDELFLLPPCPVDEKKILSSQLLLVEPSKDEFARVMAQVDQAGSNDYDMEIINQLYLDSALVLPRRPYDLLSREFRRQPDDHSGYLGTDREEWDPVGVFNEAKFIHISDWPLPKPWIPPREHQWQENQPECHQRHGQESCAEREIRYGFYSDFMERRKRICGTTQW
ncbi:glycosyltransferase [Corynascus novoguineensis]|uniref:Glycosyltransferase n=1 Tax=Corynascus novoguineensis TaxID=1126955 RepID=A0AAN7CZK9_9PEZI|nr:glycosyltransferase [Corynascus novoguineensis]